MPKADTKVRHHLLEIILWPNGDGTFREIRNSRNRLIELGIYFDYKLIIEISQSEHSSMHNKGNEAWPRGKPRGKFTSEHRNKLSEAHKCPRKPLSEEVKRKISESLKGHPKFDKGKVYH